MRVGIASGDAVLIHGIGECLGHDGVAVDAYSDDRKLLHAMRGGRYDMVLIDVKNDTVAAQPLLSWRNANPDLFTPVIVLTRHPDWSDLLALAHAGAQDVVHRDDVEQIRFRVYLILQREGRRGLSDCIQHGPYTLHRGVGTLFVHDVEVALTAREFSLAWLFFSNPGKLLSRAQIAASVWDAGKEIAARSIEQHIHMLRKKLALSASAPCNIRTVYALGYRLDMLAPEPPHVAGERLARRHAMPGALAGYPDCAEN
ncbi:response regulator transcription factor [Paraburkholderia hayleyella]|uniref:response regulator transcription factor n=1 Tax=Paraburkholderia hayleyella TaxID=2152889 RepID=UPI001580A789|nr:response regulator transcription factor [Paraburkholderia hayleyella]